MILRAVLTGAVLALIGWGRLPPLPLLLGSGLLGLLPAWWSRKAGHIHALELVADKKTKAPFPAEKRLGYYFYQKALERGMVLRPLGDVLYFNPPLTITRAELTQAMDILEQVLA